MYYKRDQANIGSRAIQSLPPTSIQIAPVGDMVETAAGSMEASIAIMQPLRPFGMIRAQTEQAKQRYHVELAQVDALRLKKATQLRQAILERKLASDSLRALQQMLELVDKMHLVVQTRVASGGTQRNELLEVEIQQTRLQQLQRDWQARLKRSENNNYIYVWTSRQVCLAGFDCPKRATHHASCSEAIGRTSPPIVAESTGAIIRTGSCL